MDQLKQFTVLYVEDEANLREELGTFIKRRVKKIFVAENGQEALDLFKKEKPDIVITDIKMPKMDGLELTRQIRETSPFVPVIVTTALSDVESILTTVDIGIDKYLLKPIDVEALTEALRGACDKLSKFGFTDIQVNDDLADVDGIEKEIQKSFAKFFKEKVGKGPRKVIAKISGSMVQVQIMESRCVYEKTLSGRPEYIKMVDYMRQSFYEAFEVKLSSLIKKSLNQEVVIFSKAIDTRLDIDVLTFKMK